MPLSDFILKNLDNITQEWEEYAMTYLPEAQSMDKEQVRDHVTEILKTIATDLTYPQSAQKQIEKSKGLQPQTRNSTTAAAEHGILRWSSGFSMSSVLAEYRALRASIIRLWQNQALPQLFYEPNFDNLIRFNEAIDQAITEAVINYSDEKECDARMFGTIMASCPDLIGSFDLKGRFVHANLALTKLLGLPLNEIVGKNHFDLNLPIAEELHRLIKQTILAKQPIYRDTHYSAVSRRGNWFELVFTPVLDNKGSVEAVICIGRNITERRALENDNWHKANYDELTKLPNRFLFSNRLEECIKHSERTARRLAVLFIDLDLFKEINDRFSHEVGDSLLQEVAGRIHSCVRQTDTAARLGGDEFTVILKELPNLEQAEIVAENIRRRLAEPFCIDSHTVQISASIGVSFYPQDAIIYDQLVYNADLAMYASKNAGGNRFTVFSPHLSQTSECLSGR